MESHALARNSGALYEAQIQFDNECPFWCYCFSISRTVSYVSAKKLTSSVGWSNCIQIPSQSFLRIHEWFALRGGMLWKFTEYPSFSLVLSQWWACDQQHQCSWWSFSNGTCMVSLGTIKRLNRARLIQTPESNIIRSPQSTRSIDC